VDRDFSSYVPNEILTWHILEWGAENGYHLCDFGGAGRSDEDYGVRDFKSKFGGELVCYGRNIYVHFPFLLCLSKLGYRSFVVCYSATRVACKEENHRETRKTFTDSSKNGKK